jgi:hypothetical protein
MCCTAPADPWCASLLSGCLATLQGDPDRLYPVQYETDAARQLLPYLEQRFYDPAFSGRERQATRNDIIARRMYIKSKKQDRPARPRMKSKSRRR